MKKYNSMNKVYQYTLEWELVDIYESMKEASDISWINYHTVMRIVNWYVKKPQKFIFKYKD
jgi:hypothetical protein